MSIAAWNADQTIVLAIMSKVNNCFSTYVDLRAMSATLLEVEVGGVPSIVIEK